MQFASTCVTFRPGTGLPICMYIARICPGSTMLRGAGLLRWLVSVYHSSGNFRGNCSAAGPPHRKASGRAWSHSPHSAWRRFTRASANLPPAHVCSRSATGSACSAGSALTRYSSSSAYTSVAGRPVNASSAWLYTTRWSYRSDHSACAGRPSQRTSSAAPRSARLSSRGLASSRPGMSDSRRYTRWRDTPRLCMGKARAHVMCALARCEAWEGRGVPCHPALPRAPCMCAS
eukprot:365347-Chlamydomonas_euryale.AAC.20